MKQEARILIVVVLYRVAFEGSTTLRGLMRALTGDPALLRAFELLIWDNSPEPQHDPGFPIPFRYHHAEQNAGVAGAYNGAAAIARDAHAEWLLLFDHDTEVNAAFLHGMLRHAEEVVGERQIAAVAPILLQGDFVLSPRLWRIGRHVPVQLQSDPHRELRRMFAANSGTLVRLDAIDAIGGYSERFWLDYSDIDVFERFHHAGFSVWIATDLRLQHEIAMLDYDARMTPARYENYLAAESDFLDLYRGAPERLLHLARLAVRAIRQRRFADSSYARLTRQELLRRLSTSRAKRLRTES